MKKIPVCRQCEYMKLIGRARITGNSRLEGPRGDCMCEHPKAVEIFERVCPHSPRMAAFIAFTKPGGELPAIKTSPRWCPLREEAAPKGESHETDPVVRRANRPDTML